MARELWTSAGDLSASTLPYGSRRAEDCGLRRALDGLEGSSPPAGILSWQLTDWSVSQWTEQICPAVAISEYETAERFIP